MGAVARVALIGCGAIGSLLDESAPSPSADPLTHASAVVQSDRATLVAVCDADEARARECALKRGVPAAYSSAAGLLDAEPVDIVIVATPPGSHAELVGLALDRGVRTVWCEKPLAPTADEARTIAARGDAASASVVVNHLRRWSPALRWMREAVTVVGPVTAGTALYTKGIANNGTHVVDLLIALVGRADAVLATGAVDDGRSDDPTVSFVLRFATGAEVHVAGADHRDLSVLEVDLLGRAGRVAMRDGGRTVHVQHAAEDAAYPGYRTLGPPEVRTGGLDGMFAAALDDVVDVALGVRDAPGGAIATDAVAVLEVVEAVHRSRQSGGWEPVVSNLRV